MRKLNTKYVIRRGLATSKKQVTLVTDINLDPKQFLQEANPEIYSSSAFNGKGVLHECQKNMKPVPCSK